MPDAIILAAKIAVLERFFAESQFEVPGSFAAILGHPENLPERFSYVFTEPSQVIAYNLSLRENGWFLSPGWPRSFLAIGEDPGGNVLYFDATTGTDAVWLANHETSTTTENAAECRDMTKEADSFAAYVAQLWQDHLSQDRTRPVDSEDCSGEFEHLRSHAHPLLLENYFEESAARYDAFSTWKNPMGDYYLFFALVNLTKPAADALVVPAMELARRQATYGRFRAGICLLGRLFRAAELTAIPEGASTTAKIILKRGDGCDLGDCEEWQEIRKIFQGA